MARAHKVAYLVPTLAPLTPPLPLILPLADLPAPAPLSRPAPGNPASSPCRSHTRTAPPGPPPLLPLFPAQKGKSETGLLPPCLICLARTLCHFFGVYRFCPPGETPAEASRLMGPRAKNFKTIFNRAANRGRHAHNHPSEHPKLRRQDAITNTPDAFYGGLRLHEGVSVRGKVARRAMSARIRAKAPRADFFPPAASGVSTTRSRTSGLAALIL